MATKKSEQQLSTLIINKVDSEDTFNEMIASGLVGANELYLIEDDTSFEPITTLQIDNLFS